MRNREAPLCIKKGAAAVNEVSAVYKWKMVYVVLLCRGFVMEAIMRLNTLRIVTIVLVICLSGAIPGVAISEDAADTPVAATDPSVTVAPTAQADALPVKVDAVTPSPETGTVPCVWTGVDAIVAVGDVHGDYDRFIAVLQAAQVIDDNNQWIGGKTHLVQTGDVPDRWPDSRKVLDLLMDLERQASYHGGAVHALIGNHEAMILQNDLRYVHPGEFESHGGESEFKKNMAPDGKYGSWISRHNAVIRINDTVFVHGGLSLKYAVMPIDAINRQIREELQQSGKEKPDSVIKDNDGPLWYRGYAEKTEEEIDQMLPSVLKALSASRMVIGHTVSKDGIVSRCDGRVVMIDVGLSRAYEGQPACLRIRGDKVEIVELESVRPLEDPLPAEVVLPLVFF